MVKCKERAKKAADRRRKNAPAEIQTKKDKSFFGKANPTKKRQEKTTL
jgi:hypothetical protein